MSYWNEFCRETDTEWHWHLEGDGSLFIEFEGSTSKLDWIQNFRFHRLPYKDMPRKWRAHKGFIQKWKSVQDRVIEIVREYGQYAPDITVFGYSQGGAIATLAHEDIWFQFPEYRNKLFTRTEGAPRCVSWHAPDERWSRMKAVWLGWDIVHQVPWIIMGYKHVGEIIHLGRKWIWPLFSIRDHLNYRG